jgi:hypothetical protein
LRSALKDTLGYRELFGGQKEDDDVYNTKVAVTTTTAGRAATEVIISNYDRPGTSKTYQFLRAEYPGEEVRVWEAGAATSAAYPYFRPFIHEPTGNEYLDGAFFNNNPVNVANRECKLLWPDVRGRAPDIFLSIGTAKSHDGPVPEGYAPIHAIQANSVVLASRSEATLGRATGNSLRFKWR